MDLWVPQDRKAVCPVNISVKSRAHAPKIVPESTFGGLKISVAHIAVKLAFWRYLIVYIGRQIDIFILTLLVTFRGIAGPFVW